ncbi:MAG: YitT family protein [Bacteroidota bacterium]
MKAVNYKKITKEYLQILIGSAIMALGFVLFISPYKLAPGGVYGVAITVHHLTKGMFDFFSDGLPIGGVALSMDIPLAIIGTIILGPKFGFKTVVGFVSLAIFTDSIAGWWGDAPLIVNDPLLSSIFGGAILGLGLGLIFRTRATSGGTDIVAMIINKFTRLPVGTLLIIVDSVVVAISVFAYKDWKIAFYSLIVIYITGKVIDVVIQGISNDKTVYIISDKYEEIRNKIIHDLERGGTYIHGEGMYNNQPKKIIYTIVDRKQLPILIEFVHEIDPNAFLSVIKANQTLGNGFQSLREATLGEL